MCYIVHGIADSCLAGEGSRLRKLLLELAPDAVFIAGMPLEYSVRFTALETKMLCDNVFVIEDACWYVRWLWGVAEQLAAAKPFCVFGRKRP